MYLLGQDHGHDADVVDRDAAEQPAKPLLKNELNNLSNSRENIQSHTPLLHKEKHAASHGESYNRNKFTTSRRFAFEVVNRPMPQPRDFVTTKHYLVRSVAVQ